MRIRRVLVWPATILLALGLLMGSAAASPRNPRVGLVAEPVNLDRPK